MNVYLLLTVYKQPTLKRDGSYCHALAPLWRERDITTRRVDESDEASAWPFLPANLGALPVGKRDAPERRDMADWPISAHVKVESGD